LLGAFFFNEDLKGRCFISILAFLIFYVQFILPLRIYEVQYVSSVSRVFRVTTFYIFVPFVYIWIITCY
jgi:hypothetical protein